MLEAKMLSNPNLSASENCLVEVQDIERYYIKDNKLYCYGLEEKKLVRDGKRKLKTYIFDINDDTIKKVSDKKNLITVLIANIIVLFVGLIVLLSMHQMEIGLFMIAFVLFINVALHKNDNDLFHRCQEFYTLHKGEIKDYTEGKDSEDKESVDIKDSEDKEPVEDKETEYKEPVEVKESKDKEPVEVKGSEDKESVDIKDSEDKEPVEDKDSEDKEPVEDKDSEDKEPVEDKDSEDKEPVDVKESEGKDSEDKPVDVKESEDKDSEDKEPVEVKESNDKEPVELTKGDTNK